MKTTRSNRQFPTRIVRSSQRGISIISVLLGLVVAALVTGVAYDQFQNSQRKARIDAVTTEIATMITEAQKIYGSANQYGSVTTAVAVQGGVVPPRLRVAGTATAQNKYNGAITFTPATITTANDSLTLGFASVTNIDCQDIVLSLERFARRVNVGAQVPKPNDGALNLGTLASACDAADTVQIDFTFGRQ